MKDKKLVRKVFLYIVLTAVCCLCIWASIRFPVLSEPLVDLQYRLPKHAQVSSDIQDADRLRFAVAAMVSVKETFSTYKMLVHRVCDDIGRKESFVLHPSYTDVRKALEKGEIDVAFVCTGTFVHGQDRGLIELLVQPEFEDGLEYRSVFIVPTRSSVSDLKDLKGMNMAFTDPESNTGRIVPTVVLTKTGFNPGTFFKKIIFTGSHDRSIQAVALRVVDVAAVDSLIWESAKRQDHRLSDRIKVIWESEAFGPPPIVVPKSLDKELKSALRKSFLALDDDDEGRRILSTIGIKRFVAARPDDYRSARKLYEKFKKLEDL